MGKIFTVALPDIGEGVVEGEVIEWCKKIGETLQQDEPVVIVMTDKATVELPAPYPGILVKQYHQPGEIAIRDRPLYDISVDENVPISKASPSIGSEITDKVDLPQKSVQNYSHKSQEAPSSRGIATPKVRAMAKQMGISLSDIQGSGKNGLILAEDIAGKQKCAQGATFAPWSLPNDEVIPLIGIKARMAETMSASKTQIPHFSYFEQVDASRLVQLRKNVKLQAEKEGIHLTFMPFILRALSLCIAKHPILNSSYDKQKGTLILHRKQNMGIAVSTTHGLIVPVLKDVETMNLEMLIHKYEELIERAQSSKLHSSDMKEGTITISNFGKLGNGLWATPVINPPEAAILALGRIHPQVIVRNGEIIVHDTLNLSWSFDHRIIDGENAAKISHDFCVLLDNPSGLL